MLTVVKCFNAIYGNKSSCALVLKILLYTKSFFNVKRKISCKDYRSGFFFRSSFALSCIFSIYLDTHKCYILHTIIRIKHQTFFEPFFPIITCSNRAIISLLVIVASIDPLNRSSTATRQIHPSCVFIYIMLPTLNAS